MKHPNVKNYIGGEFIDGGGERLDVVSPINGSHLSTVSLSTSADVDDAVQAAARAFPAWSSKTIKERAQVAYRYRELLLRHIDELSQLIHVDHGKTTSKI